MRRREIVKEEGRDSVRRKGERQRGGRGEGKEVRGKRGGKKEDFRYVLQPLKSGHLTGHCVFCECLD